MNFLHTNQVLIVLNGPYTEMALGCIIASRKLPRSAAERLLPLLQTRKWLTMAAETPAISAEEDPVGVSQTSVSHVYTVPNQDIRKLYPRGLPKVFSSLSDTFNETGWLLRPQIYDILSQLKNSEIPMSQKKYLLHGGDGCGKTLASGQIVHWCWKAGWFVIHVPGVSFWAHSRKELRPSLHDNELFDQPQDAASWLGTFKHTNAKFLKTMKLSEGKAWSRHESSEAGVPLVKLVELGIQKPVLATDIIAVLLREVILEHQRQSSSTEGRSFQLLLSIDEFNSLYNPCAACISKFESVETRQLNLLKYFRDLVPHDKFPGATVLSLSRRKLFKFFPLTTSPDDLLGKKGMKDVAGYQHVEVNNLSKTEALNLLKYYKRKRWINREPFDQVCEEVWHLSGGNVAEIYKLSQQL